MNNQEILQKQIQKDLNEQNIVFEPIDKGVMNKVYTVKTPETEYILRSDTAEESRFELEAWAMDEARKRGVPNPKAIKTNTINLENEEKINYMIQEKLSGKALSEDFPENINELLKEAGKKLKLMHSIKLNRYGHLTPERKGVVRSWPEFLFFHFKSSNSDYLDALDFLTSDEIDKATYLINERISNFNLKQGYMLHVDLRLDHIFYNNNEIEGFIDFQNVGSGDPLYDIATFDFYNETIYLDKDYTSPLIEGYGLDLNDETKEALVFYKLCLAIWKITGRIKSKREDTVPRVRELARSYIEFLS